MDPLLEVWQPCRECPWKTDRGPAVIYIQERQMTKQRSIFMCILTLDTSFPCALETASPLALGFLGSGGL